MAGNAADRVGQEFGPYRLESLLGRGGMGEVYRARDTKRDRIIALKLLPPNLAEDPVFTERFRRECQTLARLDEPHIIPIHDFGEIDGQLYLDMRLVNGRDLRAILRERGALEPAEAVAFIEQVAAALDAAHHSGLVHRDVKPENVLVTTADFAYLADFGVAHAETDSHLTQTGTAVGSIAYMAPEQFDGGRVTAAADVYALSVMLFELLTGRKPYPGDSISTITKGVLFDPIPVASQLNRAITPAMDSVLAWGLHKTPDGRCPSPLDLARAARAALGGQRPLSVGEPDTRLLPAAGSAPTVAAVSAANSAVARTAVDRSAVSGPHQPGGPDLQHGYGASAAVNYPPPSRRSDTNVLLIAVVVVLIAALVGVGAWVIIDRLGGSGEADQAVADGATPTAGQAGEGRAAGAPEGSGEPDDLPSGASPCPGIPGLATHVGRKTSCEFAASVRDAYLSAGAWGETRVVNGWAPQQRATVPMTCTPHTADIVICRGGTQSIVYLY